MYTVVRPRRFITAFSVCFTISSLFLEQSSFHIEWMLYFDILDESALYKCPDRLRLPLVFYYAHTAVVYVNKLILAGLLKVRFSKVLHSIFVQEEVRYLSFIFGDFRIIVTFTYMVFHWNAMHFSDMFEILCVFSRLEKLVINITDNGNSSLYVVYLFKCSAKLWIVYY